MRFAFRNFINIGYCGIEVMENILFKSVAKIIIHVGVS